jgi:hypothetical protein
MEIVPFKSAHLRALALQEAQAWMGPMLLDNGYGVALKNGGPCFTLLDGDDVIICSGIVHVWENRAQAWALISGDAGQHFVRIFRAMRSFLELQDTRRIEATVDPDFEQGHRLMRMLGFQHEGLMRAYLTDGRDACLYGRVK